MAKKKQAQQAQQQRPEKIVSVHTDTRYIGKAIGDPVSRKINRFHDIADEYERQQWSVKSFIDDCQTGTRDQRLGSLGKRLFVTKTLVIVANGKQISLPESNHKAADHKANVAAAMIVYERHPNATIVRIKPDPRRSAR